MEELKRFENDLRNNEELRKKLDDAVKRITSEGEAANDVEVMVKAAKELGYEISIAALEQAKAKAEEMDADELKQISGGNDDDSAGLCLLEYSCFYMHHQVNLQGENCEDQDGHNGFCWTAWHCATAVMHTEGGTQREACWSNYNCMFINN